MANYLIINLRRLGDVISTSHLIHSIKTKDPSSKIGLVVFEETNKAAKVLNNIDNIFTINRDQIVTLKKNKLFSNSFALNKLQEELSHVESHHWDHIINYSNDKTSCFLTSYLKKNSTKTSGVSFNNNIIQHSCSWSNIFNDVMTTYKYSGLHFQDCYHNYLDFKPNFMDKETKFQEDHEKASKENFDHIKKVKGNKKIIAIQLLASTETKNISLERQIELTEMLLESATYYPIFLIAPTKAERDYMETLNKEFGSSLISVETDFLALSSVLKNVDLLITPDTSIKHLADANSIPLIEISLGEAPLFKQGTTTRGNLIITLEHKNEKNEKRQTIKENNLITASDIYNIADYYFLKVDKKFLTQNLTPAINVYEVDYDTRGISYGLINKELNVYELKRKVSRELMYRFATPQNKDNNFHYSIRNISSEVLSQLMNVEKNAITEIMKDLLSCLRSTRKSNNSAQKELFKNLDKLLKSCEQQFLGSIPVILFSSELDSLSRSGIESGLKSIETLLYKLKNNLQTILGLLKEIEIDEKIYTNERRIKDFQIKRTVQNPILNRGINAPTL